MKSLIAGIVCAAFSIGPALAQTVEFRGAFCLTATTSACTAPGWNVGDCFLMRYSPPMLGTNGAGTELTVLGQSYGDNYSKDTGSLVGSTMKPVVGLHVGRTGYSFSSTMRIQQQQPSPLLSTSKAVSFVGDISNFGDSLNCTATFRASGSLRP